MPERFPIHGTPNEVKMLRDCVRASRRDPVIQSLPLPRRRRAGGSSSPPTVSIAVFGGPTGGNLVIPTTVNSVAADVEIALPATTTDILAAFETHSEISSGSLSVTSASGSAEGLPNYEITLSGAVRGLEFGAISNNGASDMTGGAHLPYTVIRRCGG